MSKISSQVLFKLDKDSKQLVNEGKYRLYPFRKDNIHYLLDTKNAKYLLGRDGEVILTQENFAHICEGEIFFEDLPFPLTSSSCVK